MSRPKKPARIYRRPGRTGFYAYLDGHHRDISLDTDDEVEAQNLLAKLVAGVGSLGQEETEDRLSVLFNNYFDRLDVNNSKSTAYSSKRRALGILSWLSKSETLFVRQVDRSLVEKYKAACSKRVTARSINRDLSTWRQIMLLGIELGQADPTAASAFKRLKEPRHQPHQVGLSKETLDQFLAQVENGYREMFRFVLGSGVRDDEVRHFDLLDLKDTSLTITPKPRGYCDCHPRGWTSKNYRYRTIPVSSNTVVAGRVFLDKRDKLVLDKKAVWKRIQAARKKAEIQQHFSMHDLRRSWASHMLAAGHKIEQISRWLGHADVLTTMRYLRIVETEMPSPDSLPW